MGKTEEIRKTGIGILLQDVTQSYAISDTYDTYRFGRFFSRKQNVNQLRCNIYKDFFQQSKFGILTK